MIIANPTEKGTGIEFWGDFNDLNSIHDTVARLSYFENNSEAESERNNRLLSIMAYDIRHAFQQNREINKNVENGNGVTTTYYGFKTDWITLLYTISALRYNAGYKTMDENDLSNLLLIEYWTKNALHRYDAEGARFIELFINARIDITTKYVYLIHQKIVNDYFAQKPSKKRFRSIPNLISQMSHGDELDKFTKKVDEELIEYRCNISNIESLPVFNDIIW